MGKVPALSVLLQRLFCFIEAWRSSQTKVDCEQLVSIVKKLPNFPNFRLLPMLKLEKKYSISRFSSQLELPYCTM